MKSASSLLIFSLLLLAGCATYRKQPWATVICDKGKVYILQGIETNKTTSVQTFHGTFQEATFSVRRDFVLYDRAQPAVALGRYKQRNDKFDSGTYDYFSESKTLCVTYDSWSPVIANLSKQTSFDVKGLLENLQQPQCRYALTHDSDAHRMHVYDKITGAEKPLTPEAQAFMGDTQHADFKIIEDGTIVVKTLFDYADKNFTVSTWDLARNKTGPKSPTVSFGRYHEPSLRYAALQGGKLTFLFGSMHGDEDPGGYSLTKGICTGGTLRQRVVYTTHGGVGVIDVVSKNDHTVMIMRPHYDASGQTVRKWTISEVDLSTGAAIKTETFEISAAQDTGIHSS